jgi:hypothetical protein
MSSETMSLHAWEDKYALSLGVELNEDGSINPSSVILTSSIINVDYRLTYDQVDEMLDEGVGYVEEWQLGALLEAATKRRSHRVNRGSTEGMVPFPIPKGMVTANFDNTLGDYDISLRIETTHNSGANITSGDEVCDAHYDPYCTPVSSSQLIVTEMMILAGEAIGNWKMEQEAKQEGNEVNDDVFQLPNELKLPFRRQLAPGKRQSRSILCFPFYSFRKTHSIISSSASSKTSNRATQRKDRWTFYMIWVNDILTLGMHDDSSIRLLFPRSLVHILVWVWIATCSGRHLSVV